MGNKTKDFEEKFKKIKANYALMVNSGSSQIYYHYLHPVIQ